MIEDGRAHDRHRRAAAECGVEVTGVNTTPEQVAAVDGWIRERGLGERLNVVEGDMRDAFAQFDKVVSIGVLEHAGRDQLRDVIRAHADFLKPGGLAILSTINRTVKARALAITAAERVLKWIPDGTHDFDKLVKPDELAAAMLPLEAGAPVGLSFNPLSGMWKLSDDVSMNYFLTVTKPV